jgi:hypothetical protein
MSAAIGGNAILWFRKGLRLHDNLALQKALEHQPKELYPVFCLDPWFLDPNKVGAVRLRFLLQSLRDLDLNLRKLNSRYGGKISAPRGANLAVVFAPCGKFWREITHDFFPPAKSPL